MEKGEGGRGEGRKGARIIKINHYELTMRFVYGYNAHI